VVNCLSALARIEPNLIKAFIEVQTSADLIYPFLKSMPGSVLCSLLRESCPPMEDLSASKSGYSAESIGFSISPKIAAIPSFSLLILPNCAKFIDLKSAIPRKWFIGIF
jgi:hypothetical protein